MAKINHGTLMQCINTVLDGSKAEKGGKARKFPESIDLFLNLKNYDTQKDKRFSGSIKLPRLARPRFKVGIIGDAYHIDQAKKTSIPTVSLEDLKKLNKNKKLVKKLCNSYDAFLASESLIKTIPRIVGPHMNRAGKFPTAVVQGEDLEAKVEELRSTVKFQLKKVLCLGACIGHVAMDPEDVRLNLVLAVNFLISLLKKNWQNLKSVYIKSTMGKPQRVY
eukprot:NODE_1319_length_918_cov_661.783659_g1095_i0.p1 GENE.NODE_1319_length_918_cov_661.783659_g1095_i0~~NODE_1319_length_918_cov_661.783659_g1095_i0.p1  ORF type:complete len:221 (+),score=85.86 NODE_1319_length_918_cov_661.783659_g1095_i0:73-735(+)